MLTVPTSFSLSAAASFYCGFEPMTGAASGHTLAFRVERTWEAVAVRLDQDRNQLRLDVTGAAQESVEPQIRRMLGLDADPEAWRALGEREPLVGALQRRFPGFFTAVFPSPYEAAVGGIVAQRISMKQASAVRRRLSEAYGDEVGGLRVLPSPEALLRAELVPGLPAPKLGWLKGVARAALDGRLDAERLRAMPQERALAELRTIPGIGAWTAEHALLRGAGPPDGLPSAEPRVLRAFGLLLGREVDAAELVQVAEAFRPFRMWVSILAVRHLAAEGLFSAAPRRWAGAHGSGPIRQGDSRGSTSIIR